MPELPEVESLRRLIAQRVLGAQIRSVCFVSPEILRSHPPADFRDAILNRSITAVERRGKYLLLHLSASDRAAPGNTRILVVHLRMRGSIQIEPVETPPGAYLCATLELDKPELENRLALRYYDMWRWGEWWLSEPDQPSESLIQVAELGPEPFAASFTAEYLHRQLTTRRGALKPLLLGQRIVAGLGNIYCDESLHRARLHPARRAAGLTASEAHRLHAAIVGVLKEAVAQGGAYADLAAAEGRNLEDLADVYTPRVYDRPGFPCPHCGQCLEKMSFHGRGTTYCPVCQPDADAD